MQPKTALALLALLVLALPLAARTGARQDAGGAPHGRYLEARTCSVFAGPCHYNGELTTTGREALVAWSFEGGEWEGVSLAGVKAVAAVVADRNLGLAGARRECVLYLDRAASPAQRAAAQSLLTGRYAAVLGQVLQVRTAPIELAFEGDAYDLSIPEVAELRGVAMPDRACCSMPESVCYRPFVEGVAGTLTEGVLVGCSQRFRYDDRTLPESERPRWARLAAGSSPRWARYGQNDAFLARFESKPAGGR